MKLFPNVTRPVWCSIGMALIIGTSNAPLMAQSEALYLEGDLFVQSNLAGIELGFPSDGNRWRFATTSLGADLLFRHKPDNQIGFNTRFVFEGDTAFLGVGGNPSARLHILQGGQSVGLGLRFADGTVNQDWNITHGFSLRLHYGDSLRGFFNANTGEYVQSSDRRLKTDIRSMPSVLSRVVRLEPSLYRRAGQIDDKESIGFVAQDLLPLFPELDHYSEADELYGINYSGFSVVAMRAIQELHGELLQRDRTISDLEQRIARLEGLLQD